MLRIKPTGVWRDAHHHWKVSQQVTIALTIALATIVTFFGARLTWQYHSTRAYERALQRRLSALERIRFGGVVNSQEQIQQSINEAYR